VNEAISIVYTTCRRDPAFDWFADALATQISDEDVEVIMVDGCHDDERTGRFSDVVAGRFAFVHVPAKPSPYNGPYRLTKKAYFAAASARNTGIVWASKPFVVFIDDAVLPMPGWWDEVVEASRHEYLVAGGYQKHWEMRVERGALVSSRSDPSGIDTRWDLGHDERVVPLRGEQLFGCSLGIPRRTLLDVGGFDELCDSVAGEDYQLGIRLGHAGLPLFYSRRMLTIESEEHHLQGPYLARLNATLSEVAYLERLREFGVSRRSTDGPFDSSHMVLDIVYGRRLRRSIGNPYELRRLRPEHLTALVERFPERHWFTGQALSEM
jgi:glycosyltransferase involved in cell wall biosynthesis